MSCNCDDDEGGGIGGISEPVLFLVLPIVLGFVGGALSAFNEMLKGKSEMMKTMRDMQMMKAIEVCKAVTVSMDHVHASLKYDVWYIAWRRALPSSEEDAELIESDKEQWKEYQEGLHEWRSHELQYETEMKAVFGEHGYEDLLFAGSSKLINQAAQILREIYYFHDSYENMTAERKESSRVEFDILLTDMQGKIKILNATMIRLIQSGMVGTLRGADVPPEEIPEEWHKEAGTCSNWEADLAKGEKYKYKPDAGLAVRPLMGAVVGAAVGIAFAADLEYE
jgi:hypothetical protein